MSVHPFYISNTLCLKNRQGIKEVHNNNYTSHYIDWIYNLKNSQNLIVDTENAMPCCSSVDKTHVRNSLTFDIFVKADILCGVEQGVRD